MGAYFCSQLQYSLLLGGGGRAAPKYIPIHAPRDPKIRSSTEQALCCLHFGEEISTSCLSSPPPPCQPAGPGAGIANSEAKQAQLGPLPNHAGGLQLIGQIGGGACLYSPYLHAPPNYASWQHALSAARPGPMQAGYITVQGLYMLPYFVPVYYLFP